jgi:hypothetical protein
VFSYHVSGKPKYIGNINEGAAYPHAYIDNSLHITLHFRFVSIDETDVTFFIEDTSLCLMNYKINNLLIFVIKHNNVYMDRNTSPLK